MLANNHRTVILVADARKGKNAYESIHDPSGIWSRPSTVAYLPPSSNMQISAVLKSFGQDRYKLLFLLAKHGIAAHIGQTTHTDSSFYARRKNRGDGGNTAQRDDGQAAHIMYHLRLGSPIESFESYLDLGGGNGGISLRIGAAVGAKSITVVDVQPQAIEGATWAKDMTGLSEATFDLVTVIFALHHFKDLDGMLRDLRRVMKPGAILCIKEHDCWSAVDAMMVDIEHSIFMYGKEKIVDDHTVHFKNFTGWEAKLAEYQFEPLYRDYFCGPREELTPTRAYIGLFKKVLPKQQL